MATVNTVLGPLDTAKLGFTLMHEHLLCSSAGIPPNYSLILGEGFLERIVSGLKQVKAAGIDTIVDATTVDLGRDVNIMAEASRRSGVNVIACTGWWLDLPREFTFSTPDQYAEMFIHEIEHGIAGTGIKPGILKSASDVEGVTHVQERILRGVARAHRRTGLPIMLHSYSPGQVGLQQLAILRDEGVDLRRVKVDHSSDTTDTEYLISLMQQGCYLGLERYPGINTRPLARTRTMKALIDAGYVRRLCPSHDGALVWARGFFAPEMQREREKANPYGFLYLQKVVFPWLREMGVPDSTINIMFTEAPRAFFEGPLTQY